MQSSARILFAGTPEFSVPALLRLIASRHNVIGVLTQPDRPAGRGRALRAGPVKETALSHGIPVMQPAGLRDANIQHELSRLAPDLMVVVAYGLLLPAEVLAIPRAGCVNIHASLLPRWRGASPINAAILAGDDQTGVSLMRMEQGLDTGPVFASQSVAINPLETAGELHDRLASLGGELLARHLDSILAGELEPQPQASVGVTYAPRINKSDGNIDWHKPATEIVRAIRAYNPWPVAQTTLLGEQLRCWKGETELQGAYSDAEPGTVLAADERGILVQTGEQLMRLTEVQAPGRKRVSAAEFAHARALDGTVLGR
jgi:methionyl-tRNA formyltransferase